MSRTHAHLPYHALYNDRRYVEEHHDHRDGVCDLPPLEDFVAELTATSRSPWRYLSCTYALRWYDLPSISRGTAREVNDWMRAETRADRRRTNRILRNYSEDVDDLLNQRRRPMWW